jgi:thiol-disulfide isomerase/thioredoxin
MTAFRPSFLLGLCLGVALTMAALDAWGAYLQRTIADEARPRLLTPVTKNHARHWRTANPPPWLPETSGQMHESWRLRAEDGREVTLGQFKGQVLFLDFWSTTCEPCIEEMPAIQRLKHSLQNEQVAFLAVTWEDPQQVRKFLKDHPLEIPVYFANGDTPPDLEPPGYPTTYILDTSGAAVFRQVGTADWDHETVRSFLSGLQRPGN